MGDLSLENYCAHLINQRNHNMGSVISYCKFKNELKPLVQKDKKMNTYGNQTQMSRAMRYAQISRINSPGTISNNGGISTSQYRVFPIVADNGYSKPVKGCSCGK